MVNISKQDSTNISEIINESLDLLNDISKTVETNSPIIASAYVGNKLTIGNEDFKKLMDHKKYLLDKYVRQTSFSKRVDKIQSAQERMKLLMKSVPNSPKASFSASQRLAVKQSIGRNSGSSKDQSFGQNSNANKSALVNRSKEGSFNKSKVNASNTDFEKLYKLREIELQAKDKVINDKEVLIFKLQNENDKYKLEIEDLNELVSLLLVEYVDDNEL